MGFSTTYALMGVLFYACAVGASPVESDSAVSEQTQDRDSRLFNQLFLPFLTIKVNPVACNSNTDNATGICTAKKDCSRDGGMAQGSCANGYGVCCVYVTRCGGTANKNVTYLVNDAYPEALKDIDNCQYTIEKTGSDICQLRLDFLTMTLAGPDTTTPPVTSTTSCNKDTFTFVGTAGSNPTVICGENSGQHMYLDLAQGAGAARINIATTDQSVDRSWRIKVTQIKCDSVSRAPAGCLQYYTEYSGVIKSFNYQDTEDVHQLGDQRYTICIRTREGFCGIKYVADHFSMTEDGTAGVTAVVGTGDITCIADFVTIPSLDKDGLVTLKDRYCGNGFIDYTTYSRPFEIRVVTDSNEAATGELNNRGFDMRYTQIPC